MPVLMHGKAMIAIPYTTPAGEQRLICGIDDGVNSECGDVGADGAKRGGHG